MSVQIVGGSLGGAPGSGAFSVTNVDGVFDE